MLEHEIQISEDVFKSFLSESSENSCDTSRQYVVVVCHFYCRFRRRCSREKATVSR